MAIREIIVEGYRSIRRLRLKLQPITVVTGPNGSGKSNLYRALTLIAQAARGRFARTIADEGGMQSAVWAGPRLAQERVRMSLGVRTDDFGYELVCGLPAPPCSFALDPHVKEEAAWLGNEKRRSHLLCDRTNSMVRIRNVEHQWVEYPLVLTEGESLLSQLQDPERFPEMWRLRSEFDGWRFYHQFRTDLHSPLRQWQVATYTPVLGDNGDDLAAALATILVSENAELLAKAVRDALGTRLMIANEGDVEHVSSLWTRIEIRLVSAGLNRSLTARELSDGTLRFLCLASALLSPRPAPFLALNEPETSLHPDLIPILAGLIVDASRRTQIWVTTHSPLLAERIRHATAFRPIELQLVDGRTEIVDGEE